MKRIVLWLMIGLMVVSLLQPIGVKAEALLTVDELFAGENRVVVSNIGYGGLTVKAEDETILFSRNVWEGKQTLELNRILREGELISFYLNGQFVHSQATVNRKVTIPAPTLDRVNEDSREVTGIGTIGTTVELFRNGEYIDSQFNQYQRLFTINLRNALKTGDKVGIRLKNDRGEVSPIVETTVQAETKEMGLRIEPYFEDMYRVTGSVNKWSKIYLSLEDGTMLGQVEVRSGNNFSVEIPERLHEGDRIIVTPYSTWGREGNSQTITVQKPRTILPRTQGKLYPWMDNMMVEVSDHTPEFEKIRVIDEQDNVINLNHWKYIDFTRPLVAGEKVTIQFIDFWGETIGEYSINVKDDEMNHPPIVNDPGVDEIEFVRTVSNQQRIISFCPKYDAPDFRLKVYTSETNQVIPEHESFYECNLRFEKPFETGQMLTLKVIDKSSNETVREVKIEVVEATKLSSPSLKPLSDRSTWIEGTVERKINVAADQIDDQTVYVYDNRQNKLCETHVNFDRTFSCPLKGLLPAGTIVSITQTADGYYPSDPTVATVSRTFNEPTPPIVIVPPSEVKPGAPILHPVTSDALGLTGSGTPGLVVKAWNEFGFRLGEATVNTDGSFRIPLERKLPQGIGIRVVQLQDGKISDGAQTYVQEGENVTLRLMDTLTDASTRLTGHLERMAFTPVRVELRQGKTVLAKDETTFFFRLDFKPQNGPLTLVLIHADGNETMQTIQPLDTTPPTLATMSTLTTARHVCSDVRKPVRPSSFTTTRSD